MKEISVYSMERPIPSCDVTKDLLLELEEYILMKVKDLYGDEIPGIAEKYSLKIYDKFGDETIRSINEHSSKFFSDQTRRISIVFNSFLDPKLRLNLRVDFAAENGYSRVAIEYTGKSAKEIALSIYNSIYTKIETYKTINYFFHVNNIVHGFLFSITPALLALNLLLLAAFSVGKLHGWPVWLRLPAPIALVLLIPFLNAKIFAPYCILPTKKNAKRWTAMSWLLKGFAGYIVFSLALPYFLKYLLK